MNNQPDKMSCEECERAMFGRSDKKFCSDACRNSFNNRMNADATNFVRNVNNMLRKNRRILMEVKQSNQNIHRDKLLMKGFDFDFYTSTRETKEGALYKYCYDIGYVIGADGEVVVVNSES